MPPRFVVPASPRPWLHSGETNASSSTKVTLVTFLRQAMGFEVKPRYLKERRCSNNETSQRRGRVCRTPWHLGTLGSLHSDTETVSHAIAQQFGSDAKGAMGREVSDRGACAIGSRHLWRFRLLQSALMHWDKSTKGNTHRLHLEKPGRVDAPTLRGLGS